MQYPQIQRIIGILLMLFSTSMLPAAGVGWYYHEEAMNGIDTAAYALAVDRVSPAGKRRPTPARDAL